MTLFSPQKQRGFSLIEIMVALVIFSMISVGAYSVLTELQHSQAELEERSAQLETLQRVTRIAWHDISQASPRAQPPAKTPAASIQMMPPGVLSFTTSHWPNPMYEARSNLGIIRYSMDGDTLVKQVWPFSASPDSPPALRQALAGHVTNISFNSVASTVPKATFPVAIEMHLTLPPFGEVVQLIPLVQAAP